MLLIGYLLLALVVAAVLFYLVVALLPSGLTVTPIRDNRPLELPANRRMRLSDLDRIRIPVSLRGYRFAETDELIDRLAAEIQVRDEELERLKQRGAPFVDEPAAERPAEPGEEPAEPGEVGSTEPEWAIRELGDQAAAELAQETPAEPAARETPAEPAAELVQETPAEPAARERPTARAARERPAARAAREAPAGRGGLAEDGPAEDRP